MASRDPAPSIDRVHRANAAQRERLFFAVAPFLILFVALLGFRYFYFFGGKGFGGNPLTHQIVAVILVHAAAMSSWTILLLAQSMLAYRGKLGLHRILGRVGACLAVAVVVLGFMMGILSAHYNPQAYMMFSGPRFFLMEMLTEIALFGVFVGIAVANRRRTEIHRAFMLTATIVIASGALARIPLVDALAITPPLYAYGPVLTFGVLLLGLQYWMTRHIDRWFATTLMIVAIVFAISIPIARSQLWQSLWAAYIAPDGIGPPPGMPKD